MYRYIFSLAFLGLLVFQQPLFAQNTSFQQGMTAFGERQWQVAENAFKSISERDTAYAEAQYMLAKVYYEQDPDNVRKIGQFLDKALTQKPENVRYLVAKLDLLRSKTNNYFAESVRDAQRRDLCRKIFKLDPSNAYAHQEYGNTYMREYLRFKNAISVPNYNGYEARTETSPRPFNVVDPNAPFNQLALDQGNANNPNPFMLNTPGAADFIEQQTQLNSTIIASKNVLAINATLLTDQFDIEALKALNVAFTDLSGRATYAYDKAIQHYTNSLAQDPMRRGVYNPMMNIYLQQGEWQKAKELALKMYNFFPEDVETWLFLGTAQFYANELTDATRSFETAKSYMTLDMKKAFEDIKLLLKPEDISKYEADPENFSKRFWNSQNPRFLTEYNERKLEHYARITYADLIAPAPKVNKRGWETTRGQIIIRYGRPISDLIMEKSNKVASSGFLDGDVQQVNNRDYTQNLNLDRVLDVENTTQLYNIWYYRNIKFVFYDAYRNGDFQLYSPTAVEVNLGEDLSNDYQLIAESQFRKIPQSYVYRAPNRQVALPYEISSFKGRNQNTDLYVHAGIPITSFNPAEENIPVTLSLGIYLIDDAFNVTAEHKRSFYGLKTAQIQQINAQNLWIYSAGLLSKSGKQQVSVEFETPGSGTVGYGRQNVEIPNYYDNSLMLSDLLLCYSIGESPDNRPLRSGDLVRNGLSLTPAPWRIFTKDKSVYLYFEMYNLTKKADNSTTFEIEASLVPKQTGNGVSRSINRLFGNRQRGVSVKFTATGNQVDDGQYLDLDVTGQSTGLYTLTLRITDKNANRTVEKVKDLYLE